MNCWGEGKLPSGDMPFENSKELFVPVCLQLTTYLAPMEEVPVLVPPVGVRIYSLASPYLLPSAMRPSFAPDLFSPLPGS